MDVSKYEEMLANLTKQEAEVKATFTKIQGAKEVWFVENQLNLHEVIHDLAKQNNLKNYHVIGDFTQIPENLDVGVIVSETLGDTGIERNYTYLYSQLIARYPSAICIPDTLEIY